MSIDRDRFDRASEDELQDVSAPERVLGFLAANADQAFEASEIAARVDLEPGTVSTALSRLKERELVEHKATYWAVVEDEQRLTDYDGYERATALFNDQLGEEDPEAWREHATDEDHPQADDGQ